MPVVYSIPHEEHTLLSPREPPYISFAYLLCAHYVSMLLQAGGEHTGRRHQGGEHKTGQLYKWPIRAEDWGWWCKWFLSQSSPIKTVRNLDLLMVSQYAVASQNLCKPMFPTLSFFRRETRSDEMCQSGKRMWVLTLFITVSSYSRVLGVVRVGGQKRKEQECWKEHLSGSQGISVPVPVLPSNTCMILGSQFPSLRSISLLMNG